MTEALLGVLASEAFRWGSPDGFVTGRYECTAENVSRCRAYWVGDLRSRRSVSEVWHAELMVARCDVLLQSLALGWRFSGLARSGAKRARAVRVVVGRGG